MKSSHQSADAYDAAQPDPRKPGRPSTDGVTAIGHIHIRTTLARKVAYVRAAKGKVLAEWMREVCDKAAGYQP